jgi:hypothetical protein
MVHFICEFIWLFDLVWGIVVCVCSLRRAARCKMECPTEVLFLRANVRCKMEHPVGEKSVQHAPSFYSAPAAWYSAPIYSAPIGDALILKDVHL